MSRTHHVSAFVGALAAAVLVAHEAQAGPPLICHPFVTESGPLLPWVENERNWYSPDREYDIANLTADTLQLLSADAAVITRMENLRRATLYAVRAAKDDRIATELLTAVLGRARTPAADSRAAALAWFDAAYLIESYRQTVHLEDMDVRGVFRNASAAVSAENAELDGHALAEKAKALAPELAAEIEFAESLMARDSATSDLHRARAAAGAAPGSLLALNLGRY